MDSRMSQLLGTVEERVRRGMDKPRGERLPSIGNVPANVDAEMRVFLETIREVVGKLRQREDAVVFMSDLQRLLPDGVVQVGAELTPVVQPDTPAPRPDAPAVESIPQSGQLFYDENGDIIVVAKGTARISFDRDSNGDIIRVGFPTHDIRLVWDNGVLTRWIVEAR